MASLGPDKYTLLGNTHIWESTDKKVGKYCNFDFDYPKRLMLSSILLHCCAIVLQQTISKTP